MHADKEGRRQF